MSNAATTTLERYFDLHTTGSGWLKRIRSVQPSGKRSKPYLACSISAFRHLPDGTLKYTNFDVIVSGTDAKIIIEKLQPQVDSGRHVFIGFRIGDIRPEVFTYQTGPKAGEVGVSVKGRLLKLFFAKVDGKPQDMLQLSNGTIGNDAKEDDFYHLQTRGIGYINRIRNVAHNNESHKACSLSAIHGNADDINTTYFDVASSDNVTSSILEDLEPMVAEKRAVLVSFVLQNVCPETFVYKKGEKQGQTGVSLKGSLRDIVMAKVDGSSVDLSAFHLTGTQG